MQSCGILFFIQNLYQFSRLKLTFALFYRVMSVINLNKDCILEIIVDILKYQNVERGKK